MSPWNPPGRCRTSLEPGLSICVGADKWLWVEEESLVLDWVVWIGLQDPSGESHGAIFLALDLEMLVHLNLLAFHPRVAL